MNDLIKALEELLGHVQRWERAGIDSFAIYKAEEALSRHSSSVEGVELPGPDMREANLYDSKAADWYSPDTVRTLIAQAVEREREACAKVCEERHANGNHKHDTREECAAAIRARGNK